MGSIPLCKDDFATGQFGATRSTDPVESTKPRAAISTICEGTAVAATGRMKHVALVVALVACGGSSGGSSSATIGPGGGTVTLDGIAEVEFPAGAFPSGSEVRIEQTTDPVTTEIWDESSAIFDPGTRAPYFVNVVTDVAPIGIVKVKLFAPSEVGPGLLANGFASALEGNDGDDQELIEQFELVETATRDASSLTIDVPGTWFAERQRGVIEGVFTIAAGFDLPFRSQHLGACDGVLSKPLEQLRVTSRFNPDREVTLRDGRVVRGHPGVDFAATDGTDLYAAMGGKVTVSKLSATAGEMVTISLAGVGAITYMHMQRRLVNVGDTVCEGEKIGTSDTTGAYLTGPHLHFELAPTGSAKVDPDPCIDRERVPPTLGGTWHGTSRVVTDIPFTGSNVGVQQTIDATNLVLVPFESGGMKLCNVLRPKSGFVQFDHTETYSDGNRICTLSYNGGVQIMSSMSNPSSLGAYQLTDGTVTYSASMNEPTMTTYTDSCTGETVVAPAPLGYMEIPGSANARILDPDHLTGFADIALPDGNIHSTWDIGR
jgi:murein DD-endopeptidase MepM/ murein hydrolase activator NlpD